MKSEAAPLDKFATASCGVLIWLDCPYVAALPALTARMGTDKVHACVTFVKRIGPIELTRKLRPGSPRSVSQELQ